MGSTLDILMITYNRPEYTRLALPRLLSTCDEDMRVWIWHNGDDDATLDVVRSLASHPRVYKFHHSRENKKLREPTNWLWSLAKGDYLSKVDDDCLVPEGWAKSLRAAHADVSTFGVLGCWRFPPEDFVPELAERKIQSFHGGHRIMRNCWVEGSGYVMKRQCVEKQGLLKARQSFPNYCIRLSAAGWVNGWYYPFLRQEHMDDPRSPHSLLKCDADLARYSPLSARTFGVTSIEEWVQALRRDAKAVQEASPDPRVHLGWRRHIRRVLRKVIS